MKKLIQIKLAYSNDWIFINPDHIVYMGKPPAELRARGANGIIKVAEESGMAFATEMYPEQIAELIGCEISKQTKAHSSTALRPTPPVELENSIVIGCEHGTGWAFRCTDCEKETQKKRK